MVVFDVRQKRSFLTYVKNGPFWRSTPTRGFQKRPILTHRKTSEIVGNGIRQNSRFHQLGHYVKNGRFWRTSKTVVFDVRQKRSLLTCVKIGRFDVRQKRSFLILRASTRMNCSKWLGRPPPHTTQRRKHSIVIGPVDLGRIWAPGYVTPVGPTGVTYISCSANWSDIPWLDWISWELVWDFSYVNQKQKINFQTDFLWVLIVHG